MNLLNIWNVILSFNINTMNLKLYGIIMLSILGLVACKYSDKYKKFTSAHDFSVEYPPYLQKSSNLHPSALVQAKNDYRDIYFVAGLYDKGTDSNAFNTFCDTTIQNLEKFIREPLIEKDSSFTLNNLPVREILLTGTIEEKRILYVINFYNGRDKYYQTCGWFFRSKRNLWENDIKKSCRSLIEL